MTREEIENNVGYWQEKANIDYVNQCLERGVTDFTEIDRAFDAGFDKGYQYAVDMIAKHLLCIELSNFFPTLDEDEEIAKGRKKLIEFIRKAMEE